MLKKKNELQPQSTPAASSADDVKSLQSELFRLQSQLKQEMFRADAYDEMIQVAEAKFNISIRKKVGAKR